MRRFGFLVTLVTVLLISITALACGPGGTSASEAPSSKKLSFLYGSTSTSSSAYAPIVAQARLMNKYAPEAVVTVVETGSTNDNIKRVKKGELQMGIWTSDVAPAAYWGVGIYQGDPFPKLRTFNNFSVNYTYFIVRADSGVKTLRDLQGKKFNPGFAGSTTESFAKEFFKALGIQPDYYLGGLADVVEATKNKRIIGFAKPGSGIQLDASMLDVMTSTPIYIIPLTDEEIKTAVEILPGAVEGKIPAGAITAMPNLGAFKTEAQVYGTFVTTDIPEDLVYKWIGAATEHWDEIAASYAGSKVYDAVKDLIAHAVTPAKPIPLHAGVVRYLKEKGYDVPAKLIPAEYKAK